MILLESNSAEETSLIGESLGALLTAGDFVALYGDLGAGKTCFSGGIARGLGIDRAQPITSPTYALMNQYQGRLDLFHFDFYRLTGSVDIIELGFEEFFYGVGVCLVEWAERLANELPEQFIGINIKIIEQNRRFLEFVAHGEHYHNIIQKLMSDKKWFDRAVDS